MLERLLVEKMEHRILVGTVAFLGTMLIMGWIAINENARMAAFEEQYNARAIERGAALFALNCVVCHGEDARGQGGTAPGLDNPWLFGFSFTATIDSEVEQLNFELEQEETTPERAEEINARLAELQQERQAIIAQMPTAINNGYNPDEPNYLAYVGWGGSLEGYVKTTLIHGRPKSALYWPGQRAMVAWAQTGGGPLRMDQIDDLTAYILNFDKGSNWTMEDLNAVNQFMIIPGASVGVEEPVGDDVEAALTALEDIIGDPVNGQALYSSKACIGCHEAGVVAPATAGTFTRVEDERLSDPALEGYTAEQYLVESILQPNVYIAPDFQGGLMPQDFGTNLDVQMLADLVAYLESQDGAAE